MKEQSIEIRDIKPNEFEALGQLMIAVYAGLDGFPSPAEQPAYYEMLANIGRFTERHGARVLVAISNEGGLAGGVVYFGNMREYGSGGTAVNETDASGIRLLGVDPAVRGRGVGKALTHACLDLARDQGHAQVVLHTTQSMTSAWRLYQGLGFLRSPDLDFMQEGLPVFGFRLKL